MHVAWPEPLQSCRPNWTVSNRLISVVRGPGLSDGYDQAQPYGRHSVLAQRGRSDTGATAVGDTSARLPRCRRLNFLKIDMTGFNTPSFASKDIDDIPQSLDLVVAAAKNVSILGRRNC